MTAQSGAREMPAQSGARDWIKIISFVLAVIGLLVAGYLSFAEVTRTEIACSLHSASGGNSCADVNNSIYAKIGPLPVAILGLGGYLAILGVLIFETRLPILVRRGKLFVFGMALFGFLFSMYLTAIEAFVLQEWCQWCIISAITMTLLFGLSFARLWRNINAVPENEEA
jgi:uncharacterized membrane protein